TPDRPMTAGDLVYSPDWTPGESDDAAPAPAGAVETADSTAEPAKEIKIFQLQHASALSAGELLKELFEANDTTPDGADGNQPRIVGDPRTNVIVASGAPDQLAEIEAIVMRLDQPTAETTEAQPTRSAPDADVESR